MARVETMITIHKDGRSHTWEDVWYVEFLDICNSILSEGCAILAIWVALMWAAAIPVRLLVFWWHTQMQPNSWKRPAGYRTIQHWQEGDMSQQGPFSISIAGRGQSV